MSDSDAQTPHALHSANTLPEDPRRTIAREYMEAAERELDEERTSGRGRSRAVGETGPLGIPCDMDVSVVAHLLLCILAVTAAALACLFCYHLLNVLFVAGRIIALPVGMVAAAALSYVSACYLGVIETTSHGRTSVEDALHGGWREWFWTLPLSIGTVAVAVFCGWLISLLFADNRGLVLGIVVFFFYPFVQLSALHNASPFRPFSIELLRALALKAPACLMFYVFAAGITVAVIIAARMTWNTPPYTTLLQMGPVTTLALFVYGWLLGQLARTISRGESLR